MPWAIFVRRHRPANPTTQVELAQVLAEWKQDQPALLQRFDQDGDGRIDPVEWEAARQEARRTVTQRGAERPARQNCHVLCRPDGDRLFLLAALPPGDLTRRYRQARGLRFLRLRRRRVRARLAAAGRVRLNPGPPRR